VTLWLRRRKVIATMSAAPHSIPAGRNGACPPLARYLVLLSLVALPAQAQIFKCTDAAGHVVYQNAACPKGTNSGRVDIFDNTWTADRAEKDAAWQRHASAHEVVAGMPVRWVREALGEPEEVRSTATAGADEVWLYNLPDRSTQVGILGQQVIWIRETPMTVQPTGVAAGPATAANQPSHAATDSRGLPEGTQALPQPQFAPQAQTVPQAPTAPQTQAPPQAQVAPQPQAPQAQVLPQTRPAPQAQAVPEAPRGVAEPHTLQESPHTAQLAPKISDSRHGIARGQDCQQALALLGPPDRKRDVPAPDSASDSTTEYFYEPAGSADPTRTRVVCANGKVEGVDRTAVR
jgi:hypothetical protein